VRVVGIVLAAGEGRRIGGPKALLELGGESLLVHASRILARPGVAEVVAVLGAGADRVRTEVALPPGLLLVTNERWRDGMLSSVWRGLDEADSLRADAVLLHAVDHPFVHPQTVDRVLAALRAGAFIAVPSHEGRRGHPGGFSRAAFPALRAATPDRGARAVIADSVGHVEHVPGDAGCVFGIDTREDHTRAAELWRGRRRT